MNTPILSGRRPIKARGLALFQTLATGLARAGVAPNAISASSMVFGGAGGLMLVATRYVEGWPERMCWLGAAVFIQLRLLANLFDGMVAVEGRRGGPTGDLWNEAPDRVSDSAALIGAGLAAGSDLALGMAAALVAVFVAYLRALGASFGAGQMFIGPQAKQQRMAVVTLACLASVAFPEGGVLLGMRWSAVKVALLIVVLGGMITALRRLSRIATFLRSR